MIHSKLKPLKCLSTTRCVRRAKAISVIRQYFSTIIKTILEVNKTTKSLEAKTKRKQIILQCKV